MELIVWLEESILGDLPKQSSAVSAVVPNRGFLDPWGLKQHFRGSEIRFSRARVCMLLLHVLFSK